LYGADIFCGSGYGSALIASRTRAHLLSIDGSTEAIQNANRLYFNPRIFFCAKHFPFHLPESQFDFIACIESLEHIKDYASFFTLLAASIKPGGLLFVSVPNEEIMPHGGYKWHIKHFYADELRQLAKNVSLEEVSCFSTRCTVIQDSKSRIFYPYQINNGEILQEAAGDTLLYEFKKI
jgi:2-polyprenyl-3-methyl-5-hydroxy-6-metoxy-1,4-benzoquinol methylase